MPDRMDEPKYDTTTAKVFYRLRDLFIQKGGVYTAKSLKRVPVGVGLLVALVLIGAVLYRLSEPMGKGRSPTLTIAQPEAAKIRREAPPDQKPHWPSHEEILRRLTGTAPPPSASPDSSDHSKAPADGPPSTEPLPTGGGVNNSSMPPSERLRAEEPLESSKVFERPLTEEKARSEHPDYEYVSGIAAAPVPERTKSAEALGRGKVSEREPTGKASLFQEVRARLLSRIDTSLPGSLVVAEVVRDYDLAGFWLRRGDLLLGPVAAASPKRVGVHFDRLIDAERREYAVRAEAVDLVGGSGLAAKPDDSRLKKGLLYANDRALDYVRAFRGRVSIYNNPVGGDLKQLENRAMIVEPNTEFYVIFHQIPKGAVEP